MAVADFLLSPEAQLSKALPANWGDTPALDPTRLPDVVRADLARVEGGVSVLPLAVLAAHRVPEIAPEYVTRLEASWTDAVARVSYRRRWWVQ